MIAVTTAQEMRDAEARAQSNATTLMRAAGERIATFVRTHYAPGRIVAFAGPGNNGGDAFAALAALDA
ncbi:MAG TPA: NAD(P)H-hydrate epimerase, partial [Candidatus Baltobacteraceae bacterium]|nr:NAD(P)H-hydrate epimerase [Candidatus Baltobacteraceae bacterium]